MLNIFKRVFAIVRQGGGQTLFASTVMAPDDVTIDIGGVAGGPACESFL